MELPQPIRHGEKHRLTDPERAVVPNFCNVSALIGKERWSELESAVAVLKNPKDAPGTACFESQARP